MIKSPLQSKTLQFQIIMGMVDALVVGLQVMQPFMDPQQFAAVVLVLAVLNKGGNTYLRFLTNSAIR